MASLDYLAVAKMYGLLRLPKMPETRYINKDAMPENGWLGDVIDMDKYSYADKQQEKSRLDNLEQDKLKKLRMLKEEKN